MGLALAATLAACGTEQVPEGERATTAPTVVATQPEPGDDNVWVRAPVVVTFSEPVDPATVNDSTVLLAGDGSVSLAKALSLAGDVLTVSPLAGLRLPETLTLSLTAGITDLAGNPLEPTTLSWTSPAWLRLGDDPVLVYVADTFVYPARLDVDTQGRPAVASDVETNPQDRVRLWDGQAWADLPPPNGPTGLSYAHDVAFAGDALYLAWSGWSEGDPAPGLYVSRWGGDGWEPVGGVLTSASAYPQAATLAADASGRLVAAFSQKPSPGVDSTDLLVKRWDGSAWQTLGDKLEVNDTASVWSIELAFDPGGDPVVAWGESWLAASFVKAWDPTSQTWQALGGSLSTSGEAPSIAVRSGGRVVAAVRGPGGTLRVYEYVAPNWRQLGPDLRHDPSRTAVSPSVAEDAAGDVVVAWSEYSATGTSLEVATLRRGSWELVEPAIAYGPPSTVSNVTLRLLPTGTPAVLYTRSAPTDGTQTRYTVETLYRILNE